LQRGLLENQKVHLPRESAVQQVTSFKDGNSEELDLPPSSGRQRRLLTMQSAFKIHGNSSLSPSKKSISKYPYSMSFYPLFDLA